MSDFDRMTDLSSVVCFPASLNSNNNRLKGPSALEPSVIGRQIIPILRDANVYRCQCVWLMRYKRTLLLSSWCCFLKAHLHDKNRRNSHWWLEIGCCIVHRFCIFLFMYGIPSFSEPVFQSHYYI